MKNLYIKYSNLMDKLKDLPPLIFRLILVQGFYSPALHKVKNFGGTADFFEKMDIPFPLLNAYLAGITEALGVILLFLGLGTRIIAIPLIITMLVAIYTVHIDNGFKAINNGYQVQLYFIFMLFALMVYGSGKFSLDYLIRKNRT